MESKYTSRQYNEAVKQLTASGIKITECDKERNYEDYIDYYMSRTPDTMCLSPYDKVEVIKADSINDIIEFCKTNKVSSVISEVTLCESDIQISIIRELKLEYETNLERELSNLFHKYHNLIYYSNMKRIRDDAFAWLDSIFDEEISTIVNSASTPIYTFEICAYHWAYCKRLVITDDIDMAKNRLQLSYIGGMQRIRERIHDYILKETTDSINYASLRTIKAIEYYGINTVRSNEKSFAMDVNLSSIEVRDFIDFCLQNKVTSITVSDIQLDSNSEKNWREKLQQAYSDEINRIQAKYPDKLIMPPEVYQEYEDDAIENNRYLLDLLRDISRNTAASQFQATAPDGSSITYIPKSLNYATLMEIIANRIRASIIHLQEGMEE